MRLALRILIPLAVVIAGMAWVAVPLVDELTLKWFVRDLDIRAQLVGSAIEDPLADLLQDRVREPHDPVHGGSGVGGDLLGGLARADA